MEKLKKIGEWLKKNSAMVLSIAVLVAFIVTEKVDFKSMVNTNEIKKEVFSGELKKEIEKVDKKIGNFKVLDINTTKAIQCSPQQAKIVLSDSELAKSMNLLVIDLNNFNIKTVKEVKGYFTKEQLICVKRNLIPTSKGTTQYYISICEPKDKLNYNKMAFDNKEKFIQVKKE